MLPSELPARPRLQGDLEPGDEGIDREYRQAEEILNSFETAVQKVPAVMECYLMAGDADYVVRVAVAGVQDYERIHKEYLSRLPHVARIRSIFAMRTVYKSTAVELQAGDAPPHT